MPIATDLSTSPYYDDSASRRDRNYVRVAFRPGVSVQVRELNELQAILQDQLELVGDNLFQAGTILAGCPFTFHDHYPYVKLEDLQADGQPAIPSAYVGHYVRSPAGLVAFVVNYADGFEATDPDLKTIYLRYQNGGDDGETSTFSAGDTLTVSDSNTSVRSVVVNNGGSLFANSDQAVFVSALVVNVTSSNSIANGYTLNEAGRGVNVVVVEANTTAYPGKTLLKIRPRTADLANTSKTASAWTMEVGDTITGNNGTAATVEVVVGSGVSGLVTTDSAGTVERVAITSGGEDYDVAPWAGVKPANTSATLGDLSLTALNYLAQVVVSENAGSVGEGYAFEVGSGVVWQKGFALRVEPQTVVVSRYDTVPDGVVAGFDTSEDLVDSDEDPDLLDNVTGELNELAPGADRLRLTPLLVVSQATDAAANDEFFSLAEWSEGLAFRQRQSTVYSTLGDEMARRTSEQSGDFVVDRFLVTARSPANSAHEGNTVSIVVDPGKAYVSGYRVETRTNFVLDVEKGLDTRTLEGSVVSIDYGRYVRVNEVGGLFQFNTGDLVNLYDTAKHYLSNVAASMVGDLTPAGTKIGEARMRSMVLETGVQGDANAAYRVYLFDVQMSTGRNFSETRALAYDGASNDGVADVLTETDPTTEATVAVIRGQQGDRLLFPAGASSLRNANNLTYTYRTVTQTANVANTGLAVVSLAANPNEFFPYTGNLTSVQLQDLYVAPLSAAMTAAANAAGNGTVATTSANVTGGVGSTYLADFAAGDYVLISNGSANDVHRVLAVANNTRMILDSNVAFAYTNSAIYRHFPRYVPLPLGSRAGMSASVDANGNILTINTGVALGAGSNTTATIAYNVEVRDVASGGTKTANRGLFVRLDLSNNAGGTDGPWTVGHPDVFRLRSVHLGANATFVAGDTGVVDVTPEFFVDHNQNPNYLGLGYLYLRPDSGLALSGSSRLLVKLDAFTSSGTLFSTPSYVSSNAAQVANVDSLPLSSLTTEVNTLEVPEVFGYSGEYYDLLGQFDFRPSVVNTAVRTTNAALATVNPVETVSFGNTANPANDKKFPLPGSTLTADVEGYLGRTDSVFVDAGGRIFVLPGIPAPSNTRPPESPKDSLRLNDVVVPPYPSIPRYPSNNVLGILNRRVASERFLTRRIDLHLVQPVLTAKQVEVEQPAAFTAARIGQLERRVADLEYYVSLSALETLVKDMAIPSSVAPSINRFKYGFFVDDYSSENLLDVDDPEHRAEVAGGCLVPGQERINLLHNDGTPALLPPYSEVAIVDQNIATSNTPSTNTTSNCVSNVCVDRVQRSELEKGTSLLHYTDTMSLTMASSPGTAVLYFHTYGQSDKITVKRGSTTVKTSNDAVVLTANDKMMLANTSLFSGITLKDVVVLANGNVKYSGKIVIPHVPSSGRDYTITVDKGESSTIWRYRLCYPVDCGTTSPPSQPTSNGTVKYDGTMTVTPDSWQIYKRVV